MIIIYILSIALLLIGLADLPTGYYIFLRIIVCIASCIGSYQSYQTDESVGIATISFALLAILFNPIIPIYLYDKDVWSVLDLVAAFMLGIRLFTTNSTS